MLILISAHNPQHLAWFLPPVKLQNQTSCSLGSTDRDDKPVNSQLNLVDELDHFPFPMLITLLGESLQRTLIHRNNEDRADNLRARLIPGTSLKPLTFIYFFIILCWCIWNHPLVLSSDLIPTVTGNSDFSTIVSFAVPLAPAVGRLFNEQIPLRSNHVIV